MIETFRGSGRMTDKPHLTACFSDRSRHAASDSGIWQSRPLRIKWQDWIASAAGLIVLRECQQWQHNVALSGSIPLQPAPFLGKFILWRIVVAENPGGLNRSVQHHLI